MATMSLRTRLLVLVACFLQTAQVGELIGKMEVELHVSIDGCKTVLKQLHALFAPIQLTRPVYEPFAFPRRVPRPLMRGQTAKEVPACAHRPYPPTPARASA